MLVLLLLGVCVGRRVVGGVVRMLMIVDLSLLGGMVRFSPPFLRCGFGGVVEGRRLSSVGERVCVFGFSMESGQKRPDLKHAMEQWGRSPLLFN